MLIVWELSDKSIVVTNVLDGVDVQEEIKKINSQRPELTFKMLLDNDAKPQIKLDLFFKALELSSDNTFSYNMEKARNIWRNKIRYDRYPKLKELDVSYQRALEANDKTRMVEILAQKEILRNAPNLAEIDTANTIQELEMVYPNILK